MLKTVRLLGIESFCWDTLQASALAWLGYALFHPDTASSTWRHLVLYSLQYDGANTVDAIDVLRMMAQGNNLHVALGLSSTRVNAYFTATLGGGAAIYSKPSSEAAVVQALEQTSTMDVCVATTDVALLGDWVVVVVVGYGQAWVQRSDIESITSRPPSQPALTRIRYRACEFHQSMHWTGLLDVVGAALEHVDLLGYKCLDAGQLTQLSTLCPRLQSLVVSLSNEWVRDLQLPPQLRQLQLYPSRGVLCSSDALIASLQNLEALYITASLPPSRCHMNEFVLPLLRGVSSLQRFVWVDQSMSGRDLRHEAMDQSAVAARHRTRARRHDYIQGYAIRTDRGYAVDDGEVARVR